MCSCSFTFSARFAKSVSLNQYSSYLCEFGLNPLQIFEQDELKSMSPDSIKETVLAIG